MKINFTNPCPDCTLKGSSILNKSKLKFETESGDSVVSPYNGFVINKSNSSVVIQHLIDGVELTSTIKNFKPNVNKGFKAVQGRPIGYATGDELTFEVDPNLNAEQLIKFGVIVDKNKLMKKPKEKEKEKTFNNSKSGPADHLMDLFLTPFNFAKDAFHYKPKKKEKDDEELNETYRLVKEDIDRIKKLF